MKTAITPSYVFTPTNGTLDLSSITNFSIKKLFAVINTTAGTVIYAQGDPTTGYTAISGGVLTLTTSVNTMNAADQLTIIYDVVGTSVSASSSPVTLASDDNTALAIGTTADGVWSGTGTSSMVSALKAIWTVLTNGLKVTQPDVRSAGTIPLNVANSNFAVAVANGENVVGFTITSLTGSGATVVPEVSNDGGTTWTTAYAVYTGSYQFTQTLTTDGNIRVNASGHTNIRLRLSVIGTGTVTVTSNISVGSGLIDFSSPLPTGTNTIGSITFSGNIGTDRSANTPTGPGAATTFTYNGTALNLLSTFPVNTNRKSIEINNTTGSTVVLVIDDGNNTSSTLSIFPLTATTQFNQGGDFTSTTEQGRIRVFGTSGTFLYGREN